MRPLSTTRSWLLTRATPRAASCATAKKSCSASLDFCTLGHHFSPFHKGFQDFSRRRIQSGVFKNPFPPCGVSQSSKKVLERCGVCLYQSRRKVDEPASL